MAHPHVADGGTVSRNGEQLRIYRISGRGQLTRGGPPHHKNLTMLRNGYMSLEPLIRTDPSLQPKAKDTDKWQAVVNAAMNLRRSIKSGGFLD